MTTASRQYWARKLALVAHRENPGNSKLKAIVDQLQQIEDPAYPQQRQAYLAALRGRYNWVNTGAFVEQAGPQQTGRSSRLPLLDEAGQEGVYVPLAFDPMSGRDRAVDQPTNESPRTRRLSWRCEHACPLPKC